MKLSSIAIVGRPNVGKSAFFNAAAGSRISIVDHTAGVTRDRVSTEIKCGGKRIELIDTGGIGLFDETLLKDEVERQIEIAIASADGILFMVDIREGVVPLDKEVAKRLRRLDQPVLLVANKADNLLIEYDRHQFHSLGFGEPLAVSALERRSVFEALDRILEEVPGPEACDFEEGSFPRVAVVGKMNVGKSSLVNYMARENRVIVSEIPGTTRDSVDVRVQIEGLTFFLIDTAGIRKKRSVQDSIEFYGQARAERAIRRADVALLLVDTTKEVSAVDKRIATALVESYKPCILCLSKWDLAPVKSTGEYVEYISAALPALRFAPVAFISSMTGFNIIETFRLIPELREQAGTRVSTSEVNRSLQRAFTRKAPRTKMNKVARVYFATQIEVFPPTIMIFVNDPGLFDDGYRRYLAGRFRDELPFSEVPVRILFRGKERRH